MCAGCCPALHHKQPQSSTQNHAERTCVQRSPHGAPPLLPSPPPAACGLPAAGLPASGPAHGDDHHLWPRRLPHARQRGAIPGRAARQHQGRGACRSLHRGLAAAARSRIRTALPGPHRRKRRGTGRLRRARRRDKRRSSHGSDHAPLHRAGCGLRQPLRPAHHRHCRCQ